MKFIYSLFSCLLITILFLANSGGAGAQQGIDRTGSPVGIGSCASCHNSGTFAPTLKVELLDGADVVTTYQPGKDYQLSILIEATDGTPSGYGFQAVALSGADNVGTGTFAEPGIGKTLTTINDRIYVEQSETSNENIFLLDWTAPQEDMGDINFYVGGNAVDGGGSTVGDVGVSLDVPLTISFSTVSSVAEFQENALDLKILGNPVVSQIELLLNTAARGNYLLEVFNRQGQVVKSKQQQLLKGQQHISVVADALPAGVYFLRLSNGREQISRSIVKQ